MASNIGNRPIQSDIVQIEAFLKDFGFNARETAIYIALLKKGKASPAELSKTTSTERSDTYRILDSLVSKGFVTKILEKPVQYAVAPPGKAFKRSLEEKRNSLSTLEGRIEDSAQALEAVGKNAPQAEANKFEVIESRRYVFERMAEMFAPQRCNKEILFSATEKCATRLLFGLKESFMQLQRRGVNFRVMIPINEANLEDVKSLSKYADIRHMSMSRSRIIIVDRKESMLVYSASEDDSFSDDIGLWLNNTQFSALQAEMFDAQWRLSTELYARIREVEGNMPAQTADPLLADYGCHEEDSSVIFMVEPRGKITYISHNVNENLSRALQVYTDWLDEGKSAAYSYPEDRKKIGLNWQSAFEGNSGKSIFRTIQKDGDIFWWSVSWLPIKGKKGTVETIRCALKNVTDQKKLELTRLALAKSELRLVKSQEIAHLGSWELDLTTDRLYWTDEVYRIFGITPQEFEANYEAFLWAVHPDDREAFDAAYSLSLREGKDSYQIEHRIIRKSDGSTRFAFQKWENIRDESGQFTHSIGMVHDVTERKEAEEKLRLSNEALAESEARFRLQFNEASDPVFLADVDTGILVDCNQAALRLIGYQKNELIGEKQEMLHPRGTGNTLFKNHIKDPNAPVERQVVTKHGKVLDVVIKASLITIKGKTLLQGIFRDVTEQNRQHRLLIENQEKFKALFDANPEAVYFIDDQYRFLEVNPRFTELFGYKPHELIGKNLIDTMIPKELGNQAIAAFERLTDQANSFNSERRHKNGSSINVSVSVGPVVVNGKKIGYIGVCKTVKKE